MKRFTIIFSLVLILLFGGAIFFVQGSSDFVPPGDAMESNEEGDENSKVWSMTYEDLLDYMDEQGLIDKEAGELLAGGVATECELFNGVELYFGDVDNLEEGSDEYEAFKSLKDEGYIDLFNSGSMMSAPRNGPFAINFVNYDGDVDKATKIFKELGK